MSDSETTMNSNPATKFWAAGYITTDSKAGVLDFALVEPHSILVTPALWRAALDNVRAQEPHALLISLTPLSDMLQGASRP